MGFLFTLYTLKFPLLCAGGGLSLMVRNKNSGATHCNLVQPGATPSEWIENEDEDDLPGPSVAGGLGGLQALKR